MSTSTIRWTTYVSKRNLFMVEYFHQVSKDQIISPLINYDIDLPNAYVSSETYYEKFLILSFTTQYLNISIYLRLLQNLLSWLQLWLLQQSLWWFQGHNSQILLEILLHSCPNCHDKKGQVYNESHYRNLLHLLNKDILRYNIQSHYEHLHNLMGNLNQQKKSIEDHFN